MEDGLVKARTSASFYYAAQLTDEYCRLQIPDLLVAETKYSKVYKSYSSLYGRFVAVKVVDKEAIPAGLMEKFLPRELEITQKVNHPNLVRCFFVGIPDPTKVVIISEFCDGGTLLKKVLDSCGLPEPEAARYFRQIIEGVRYLHNDLNIVHRDIKLENILLHSNDGLKLADFGFAKYTSKAEKSTSFCGTRPYSAPQLIDRIPYSAYASGWFATGVVLYTMLCGSWPHPPFEKISYPINFHPRIGTLARSLLSQLLEYDEIKRAGYQDCFASDWLRTFNTSSATTVTSLEGVCTEPLEEGNQIQMIESAYFSLY